MDITTATSQLRVALDKNDQDLIEICLESLNTHYGAMETKALYPHLIYCHVTLFGGNKVDIDKGVTVLCNSKNITDKYDCLATAMRDSLTSTIPENDVLSRIYEIIGSYEHNDNNIWTALFAVATEEKEELEHVKRITAFAHDFYNSAIKAEAEQDHATIIHLQEYGTTALANMTQDEKYAFLTAYIGRCKNMNAAEVDKQIAELSGKQDLSEKLAFLEDVIHDPSAELELKTPEEKPRWDAKATHAPPPRMQ